ncbi:hypothetical protein G3M48_008344 [Beauveria asiatica]|uniref:Major facilitator superfamily (MFS) profile domain-containing protein n=1 Tax=Beauveria asiatica TaxID=1069075 RepID=A0AAW0RL11_9HYPO
MASRASAAKPPGVWRQLLDNPYIFGLSAFASLGGFLFGYDQGVVSGVLEMQSFAAEFPRIYLDSRFKGWFVSTLLLAAWLGSLVNGPVADRFGRKGSMLAAVVVFTLGSALQAGAQTMAVLFGGRAVAGLAVGMLTMIVPMYMSEVSTAGIRGTLVVLQQCGVRCAPDIPYTGGTHDRPRFDPRHDVGPPGHRCSGQSQAAWRVPFALQIAPALILGLGMLFYPESPRYYLMRRQEDAALRALARLRRAEHPDSQCLRDEYLAIKAEVLFDEAIARERFPGKAGASLYFAQYGSLVATKPAFRRLAVGCLIGFFQQFIGCNALIYYSPIIFSQLGLSGGTTSLLATGVYGIVNTLSTLPALFLIDRVGRRPLLLCGATGTFISLVIIGAVLGAHGNNLLHRPAAGWVGVAFVYIYDVNFSYSFAPIGWVLPSEIFNLGNRSKAMAITTSCTWMCNFIIGLVTPDMLESFGWGTYIFFAAFCLLAFLFTYLFVPETKGKSLEDMDEIFGDAAARQEKERLFRIAASLGLTAPMPTLDKIDVATADAREYA